MHIGGSHRFPFGTVKLVPAFHGGGIQGDDGSHTTNPCGLVLTLGGTTVYHTGDTGLTMEMQLLDGPRGRDAGADRRQLYDGRSRTPSGRWNSSSPASRFRCTTIRGTSSPPTPHAFKQQVGRTADVVILAPGESHTLS